MGGKDGLSTHYSGMDVDAIVAWLDESIGVDWKAITKPRKESKLGLDARKVGKFTPWEAQVRAMNQGSSGGAESLHEYVERHLFEIWRRGIDGCRDCFDEWRRGWLT